MLLSRDALKKLLSCLHQGHEKINIHVLWLQLNKSDCYSVYIHIYTVFSLSPSVPFLKSAFSKYFLYISFHIWSCVIIGERTLCNFCLWDILWLVVGRTWTLFPQAHTQICWMLSHTLFQTSPETHTLSIVFQLLFYTGTSPLVVHFSSEKHSWSHWDGKNTVAVSLPDAHTRTILPAGLQWHYYTVLLSLPCPHFNIECYCSNW